MFQINAAAPGTVSFTGSGTAQFNNSLGTSNSFQVGSNTNLGVNASASSTPEYGVNSAARLDLAGTSTMQQTIGTSGNAANYQAVATAASSAAHTAAAEYAVDAMSRAGWGASWESSANHGQYQSEADWKAGYEAAYSANYSQKYTDAYDTAVSHANTVSSSTSADGTIKGSFITKDVGSSSTVTAAQMAEYDNSAKAAADSAWGVSYDPNATYSVAVSSQSEWEAQYKNAYNSAFANASAAASRTSTSDVTVTGIGSIANINAGDTSTFNVEITGKDANSGGSSATANGSAGANLATTSFATQNNSSTASAFIQAFAGQ